MRFLRIGKSDKFKVGEITTFFFFFLVKQPNFEVKFDEEKM